VLTNTLICGFQNVENSDGTVAFRLHLGAGTDRTIGYCHQRLYKEASPHGRGKSYDGLDCYKPVYVISSLESTHFEKQSAELQRFILKNRIRVLNVIGHRETTSGYNGNFTRAIVSGTIFCFLFWMQDSDERDIC
jgi:hypothetical protein